MSEQTRFKNLAIYLGAGVITWLFFLVAFLLLTQAIMMFMEADAIGIALIILSLIFFIPNYFIFKFLLHQLTKSQTSESVLRTQHEIITGLDRLIQIITLLVSLGFITAISTFIYICMTFMDKGDVMYVIQSLPFLFVIYLVFSIPSFYAITEIGKLKSQLGNYSKIKDEIKSKMAD